MSHPASKNGGHLSIKRERDEGHFFFHGDGSKTDGTPGAHQFWVSLRVHPPIIMLMLLLVLSNRNARS